MFTYFSSFSRCFLFSILLLLSFPLMADFEIGGNGYRIVSATGIISELNIVARQHEDKSSGMMLYTQNTQESVEPLYAHVAVQCMGMRSDGNLAVAAGPIKSYFDPSAQLLTEDWLFVVVHDSGEVGDQVAVYTLSGEQALQRCQHPDLETFFPGYVADGNFKINSHALN